MSGFVREGFDRLCTLCHVHGENPKLDDQGKCKTCERTHKEIFDAHGVIELDVSMKCVVFARRAQKELKFTRGEIIDLLMEGMHEK